MKASEDFRWHHADGAALLSALKSDPRTGLQAPEVVRRLAAQGPNRLTPRRGRSPLMLFLSQFHHPLIYILLVSAAVTGPLKGWVDAGVILGVVLVNAVIGFIQEMNALRAIAALANVLNVNATVLRDGLRMVVPASGLVPGDIVHLQSGDKVPADLACWRCANSRSTSRC